MLWNNNICIFIFYQKTGLSHQVMLTAFYAMLAELSISAARLAGTKNVSLNRTIFVAQVEQALANIKALLDEANAKPEHMARMTWYLTSKTEYAENLRPIGQAYKKIMGKHYPAMSVFQVVALVEDRAKVEIEVTAVIPR